MAGMNRRTGRWIAGRAHLGQSLEILLTTPIGSRVARRDVGADDRYLQDRPINPGETLRAVMAVAVPVDRWEPRMRLTRVTTTEATVAGRFGLALSIVEYPRGHFGDRTPASTPSDMMVPL